MLRHVFGHNRNVLKRFHPVVRTLASVSLNPSVQHVRPEDNQGKIPPRWRGAVPEYVTTRIRKEVLMTPEYRNRIVGVRRAWVAVSDSTSDILAKIKMTENSDVSLLASLSHQELIQLMSEVVNIPVNKITRHTLNTLEEECCCRINNFDAASLLFIADVFHLLNSSSFDSSISSINTGSNLSARYITAMLKAFDYRWSDLITSHRDVVLLSFHIGDARKSLLHLMHRIEEYMEGHAEQFTASELALVCHAFFINNTAFRRYMLLEKISTVVERDFALPELKLHQLGCVLKALRHAQYTGSAFYEKLGTMLSNVSVVSDSVGSAARRAGDLKTSRKEHTSGRAENLKMPRKAVTLNDINNIAFVYASLKYVHPRLFQWISQVLTTSIPTRESRMKDLARLLWSYTTLAQPVPDILVSRLLHTLRTDPAVMYFYPDATVEALTALAMSGTYPVDLIDKVFSQRFLSVKSLRRNEQTFQLMLLNSSARIECNHYCGRYPSGEYMRSVSGEYYGEVERELSVRHGLQVFADTTRKLFGSDGNSMVRVHFILPHSRLADLQIKVNAKSNKPFSFNDSSNDGETYVNKMNLDDNSTADILNSAGKKLRIEKKRNMSKTLNNNISDDNLVSSVEMSKSVSDVERKISIKVMGRNQYAVNDATVLLGLHAMELRLLKQLGYEVYIISPSTAQFLDDANDEDRLKFAKKFLKDTCHISLQ